MAELPIISTQTMLTEAIAGAFHLGMAHMAERAETRLASAPLPRAASPQSFSTSASAWRVDTALQEEVFGARPPAQERRPSDVAPLERTLSNSPEPVAIAWVTSVVQLRSRPEA